MRKIIMVIVLLLAGWQKLSAQSDEAAQLLLNVEKLAQFKQILSDLKKGYEVVSKGYGTIKDISQGNFNLHKVFLDGLMEVSPTVKKYKRVADIIEIQLNLTKEYKSAFRRFKSFGHFSMEELNYIGRVYDRLIRESLNNIDELTTVLTANQLRMSDDERLKSIDRIYEQMGHKLSFLHEFNSSTLQLALNRQKQKDDAHAMQRAYGIKQ